MKNTVKVALGIVTGGVLVYLNQRRKQKNSRSQLFTAPDGMQYRENQLYRTSNGDVYKNGKKVHFDLPSNKGENPSRVDANFNNKHLMENQNVHIPEVNYHQRGIRHK